MTVTIDGTLGINGNITAPNATITSASISGSVTLANNLSVNGNLAVIGTLSAPGSVVQMVSNNFTTRLSTAIAVPATTFTDIAGFSVAITPKFASSKIYVTARWFGEFSSASLCDSMFGLKRNGVAVGNQASTGCAIGLAMPVISFFTDALSTPEQMYFDYTDLPATKAAITYQVYISTTAAGTVYSNRCVNATSGNSGSEVGSCSITAWEIAQ